MSNRLRRAYRTVGVAAIAVTAATVVSSASAGAQQDGVQAHGWCDSQSKLVILGDSTATGYGSTGYVGGDRGGWAPSEYGWASRLSRQLPDTDVINLARNGSLAADFLPDGRWPLDVGVIERERPNLVIMIFGSNEYGINLQPSEYKANLQRLTRTVANAAPGADFLFVHTWGFDMRWPWFPGPLQDWDVYGERMAEVARQHSMLDLTEVMPWADEDTAGLYIDNEYGEYKVHPTDAGHQVLFASYWGALQNHC